MHFFCSTQLSALCTCVQSNCRSRDLYTASEVSETLPASPGAQNWKKRSATTKAWRHWAEIREVKVFPLSLEQILKVWSQTAPPKHSKTWNIEAAETHRIGLRPVILRSFFKSSNLKLQKAEWDKRCHLKLLQLQYHIEWNGRLDSCKQKGRFLGHGMTTEWPDTTSLNNLVKPSESASESWWMVINMWRVSVIQVKVEMSFHAQANWSNHWRLLPQHLPETNIHQWINASR